MTYLSQHRWTHNGVEYEVNNFHLSDVDAWCYEMYALPGEPDSNDYVEVRIPDLTPEGPFTPAPAGEAVFLAHGEPKIPSPILCRFIDLMHEYGHVAWGQSVMTVAAILRRADRVLLVRETRAEIEVWGPPGGVIEPGEIMTEAVVREVNEETGLLVERIGPLGRSPGWGLAPHCSAGPAIRAVIGPSSR
jgi:hypothetical protein